MKRLILGLLVFIIGVTFFMGETYCWDPPLVVTLTEIKFNHNTGSTTNDAITLNSGYDTTITAPEWTSSTTKKIAYKKGSTSRKIKASFTHNQGEEVYSLNISASNLPYSDANFYILSQEASFSDGVCTDHEFNCSGTTASSIGSKDLGWGWQVQKVNGESYTQFIRNTDHDFYALADYPEAPFDDVGDNQAGPWTAVLDSSCVWASGLSSTTAAACSVTTNIYFNHVLVYDDKGEANYSPEEGGFNLPAFLYDFSRYSDNEVNCHDTAHIFNIYSAAIGCTSQFKKVLSTGEMDIEAKSYLPLGLAVWDSTSFNNHRYGWFNSKVFEPTYKLIQSGTPIVPVNMSENTYESLIFKSENYEIQNPCTVTINNY